MPCLTRLPAAGDRPCSRRAGSAATGRRCELAPPAPRLPLLAGCWPSSWAWCSPRLSRSRPSRASTQATTRRWPTRANDACRSGRRETAESPPPRAGNRLCMACGCSAPRSYLACQATQLAADRGLGCLPPLAVADVLGVLRRAAVDRANRLALPHLVRRLCASRPGRGNPCK